MDCDNRSETIQYILSKRNKWHPYGKIKPYWNGRIVVNPIHFWWWIVEVYLVILTASFLYEHENYNSKLTLIGSGLAFIAFVFSALVTLTNPGVLPKPSYEDAMRNAVEDSRISGERNIGSIKNIMINNENVEHKFCPACAEYRPPLTTHCYNCDCCIVNLDHHCPVIGVCVSRKNEFFFSLMIFGVTTSWGFYLFTSLHYSLTAGQDVQTFLFFSGSYTLIIVLVGATTALILPLLVGIYTGLMRTTSSTFIPSFQRQSLMQV